MRREIRGVPKHGLLSACAMAEAALLVLLATASAGVISGSAPRRMVLDPRGEVFMRREIRGFGMLEIRPSKNHSRPEEPDLVSRADGLGAELVELSSINQVDLFFALDTAAGNIRKRSMARMWLKDLHASMPGNLQAAWIFFADHGLEDVPSNTTAIQPPGNRVTQSANGTHDEALMQAWSRRWLFDLDWAMRHYHFRWIVRADDDGVLCGSNFVRLIQDLPPSVDKLIAAGADNDMYIETGNVTIGSLDECFILMSQGFVMGLLEKVASGLPCQPVAGEALPDFIKRLADSTSAGPCSPQRWPSRDTIVMNLGFFSQTGLPGGIVLDSSSVFPQLSTFAMVGGICSKHNIIWLHDIDPITLHIL